jgi:hypothetical protein
VLHGGNGNASEVRMADEDQGERVVKVGACWRFKGAPPWMVDAIEGDEAVLARWKDGEREVLRRPVRELLTYGHWRECDPEEMTLPSVNVQIAASGRSSDVPPPAIFRTRPVDDRTELGRAVTRMTQPPGIVTQEALAPPRDRPVRPDPVPTRPEDGISRAAEPWRIYEGKPNAVLNDPKAVAAAPHPPRERRYPHSYPGEPGHNPDDPGDCFTSNCAYGCGAWAGPSRSGGPEGVEPFGDCPNHPELEAQK